MCEISGFCENRQVIAPFVQSHLCNPGKKGGIVVVEKGEGK